MAYVKLGAVAEGSIVRLNEDGKPVEFVVAKQDYESELNGPGRVLLVRKEWHSHRGYHKSDANSYATSDMDAWLNGNYKSKLDPAIQKAMGTTKFYYTPGNGDFTVSTLERSVFALSCTEMACGDDLSSIFNKEGTSLPSTVLDLMEHAFLNGSPLNRWTRTPSLNTSVSGALCVGCVSYAPMTGYYVTTYNPETCTDNNKVCLPCFTLPAYLLADEDGFVSGNTPPTAPPSITIPPQINGGSTITVEWGPATDAEDNLEGYKVERSVDGGSAWTQIYQGTARSTANLVPFGTQSVMYRVKAYDAEGLESGWTASAQVTVINNTAPTTPGSINVPEAVQGGSRWPSPGGRPPTARTT